MEFNLLAICECKINAENERDAILKLSRGIEDFVTDADVLRWLSIRKIGAGIVIGDRGD